ncbi:hypothetical protein [Emcibacter nanhaiensis]|uniref:Uncharacterized protein n=1 Tax=Emcibacter nanhaiensis TaxID=1505037 RepID=A0A501PR55_9PROT|nr:hypothetical protein [Emcibacter nanhaiensis]TPD63010.1 hypothetical protein FIV46_02720 [Emcibacter nanhaiensis]
MKRDLAWYMNEAKKRHDIGSDRKLAEALNVATVARWRNPHRPDIPTPSVMVKLAKMAGIPEEVALIDRDIWDAEFRSPELVPTYKKILNHFPKYAAALVFLSMMFMSDIDGNGVAGAAQFAGWESSPMALAALTVGDMQAPSIYIMRLLDIAKRLCSATHRSHLLVTPH